MLEKYVYDALRTRVMFARGMALDTPHEIDASGTSRWLIVASDGVCRREADLIQRLSPYSADLFSDVRPHCPIEVAEAALARFHAIDSDGIIAIGGGSTIGIGKFIRLRTGKPFICLPTTFSGSEMTPIHGAKIGNEKRTGRDPDAMPTTVIYDPVLLRNLPKDEIAGTGMNSLAHCFEALYPRIANPIATHLAQEGIMAHAEGLPLSIEEGEAIDGKEKSLHGAFLGGLLVQLVGIGLHHQICHILGGRFSLSHGESNSIVLPHIVALNQHAILGQVPDLGLLFGAQPIGRGVFDLARRIGAPRDLASLGVPKSDLMGLVDYTLDHVGPNPVLLTRELIVRVFEAIWNGDEPG